MFGSIVKNRRYTWLILLIPYLFYSIDLALKKTPFTTDQIPILNNIFIGITRLENFNSGTLLINYGLKLSLIFLPFLFFSILEISQEKILDFRNLQNTSLGKIKKSIGHKYADIWYFFMSMILAKIPQLMFISTLGFTLFNSGINSWFHNLYKSYIPLPHSEISGAFIFIVFILLQDFFDYLRHRLQHSIPLLWDLHEFHHSPTQMTYLSNSRNLPLQNLLLGPILIPLTALIGLVLIEYLSQGLFLPLIVYILYLALQRLNTVLGHGSLKVIYPKFLSIILLSPSLHWIHHSNKPKHFNSNFGVVFVFWDKFFGTYLGPDQIKNIKKYGLPNSQYNKFHPLYAYFLLPFIKIKKRLLKYV